jgi:hypothetical protein
VGVHGPVEFGSSAWCPDGVGFWLFGVCTDPLLARVTAVQRRKGTVVVGRGDRIPELSQAAPEGPF